MRPVEHLSPAWVEVTSHAETVAVIVPTGADLVANEPELGRRARRWVGAAAVQAEFDAARSTCQIWLSKADRQSRGVMCGTAPLLQETLPPERTLNA